MSLSRLTVILLLLLCAGNATRAQYYEEETDPALPARFLSAGVMWRDFAPRSSNPLADSAAIRFNRAMPLLAYRQGGVELYVGYTPFGEGNDQTAVVLGTTIASEVPLAGTRASRLSMPVILAIDFAKATAGGLQKDNFNLASIGIGIGVHYRWTAPALETWIQAGQLIHVAFEGFATGTGSSAATIAEAGIILREIGIGEGVVLTYRFRTQSWRMSGGKFDYRSTFHGPALGVCF